MASGTATWRGVNAYEYGGTPASGGGPVASAIAAHRLMPHGGATARLVRADCPSTSEGRWASLLGAWLGYNSPTH